MIQQMAWEHTDVFVSRIEPVGIKEAMSKLCSMLNLPDDISSIVIKLNLCDYRTPSTGAVSDPAVVMALLDWIRSEYPSCEISLVETDATSARADILFKWLGFHSLAERYNANVVNLARGKWVSKEISGYVFDSIDVPQCIEEADLVITHPKLKTHSLTQLTCGLKNVYGCFRPRRKIKYHPIIDKLISDVNLAVKADLSIVDANICHEGVTGPASGNPKRLGLLIGGWDIVAVDAFCARLAGFRPESIPHIRYAYEKGLGKLQYRLQGDSVLEEMSSGAFRLSFDRKLYALMRLARRVGVRAT